MTKEFEKVVSINVGGEARDFSMLEILLIEMSLDENGNYSPIEYKKSLIALFIMTNAQQPFGCSDVTAFNEVYSPNGLNRLQTRVRKEARGDKRIKDLHLTFDRLGHDNLGLRITSQQSEEVMPPMSDKEYEEFLDECLERVREVLAVDL